MVPRERRTQHDASRSGSRGPDVGDAELAAVAEVVGTGQLTMGPKVAEFEAAIAEAVGTAHAAAVSSGTAALHLALLALEIGPGDEVIVPAYTFPATANVVELCGARAVLVDVDPDTFNLDVAAASPRPSLRRTRAVMAVHLFGRPVEWEALQTAVPQEVVLLEDAAGALGARYRGTPCGALGVAACLSFHPRKIVTTGEGGAVTTDEAELDAAIRRLRHHGWTTLGDMPAPGFNYRLPICCARSGSRSSPGSRRSSRRGSASPAGTRSASSTSCSRPSAAEGDRHGWQAYVVQLDRRDEALAALRDAGHRGPDRDVGAAPARPYRDAGSVPRRRPRLRACARAALRDDDDRGGGRARRGGVDRFV